MDSRFHLAPLVGALIGLVVFLEATALRLLSYHGIISSSLFAAAAILATVYFGSRFLHFDGLADFGDGSIVAGTQADHIRALKDTLIGAGGLGVALIVTLLNFSLYSAAFAFIIVLAPVTEVLTKNAQVVTACYGLPSNGMAGRQVEQTNGRSMVRSCGISLVLILVFAIAGLRVDRIPRFRPGRPYRDGRFRRIRVSDGPQGQQGLRHGQRGHPGRFPRDRQVRIDAGDGPRLRSGDVSCRP